MSKSQFVSFVPKTLDNNIDSRDINDDVIATVIDSRNAGVAKACSEGWRGQFALGPQLREGGK
jgi:hypothetical protein